MVSGCDGVCNVGVGGDKIGGGSGSGDGDFNRYNSVDSR